MARIAAALCVLSLSLALAGCALVSNKTKTSKGEKKQQVKVLGFPIWKTEHPAPPPAE